MIFRPPNQVAETIRLVEASAEGEQVKSAVTSNAASDDAEVYEAIGRFTVAFAIAETCADALAALIFNGYGGKNIVARLPRVISLKLKFLETAARLPSLALFESEIMAITKIFETLLEPRHFIVHGIFGENQNKETVFAKPVVTPDNMHMIHFAATVETINSHRVIAEKLVPITAGLAIRLNDNLKANTIRGDGE